MAASTGQLCPQRLTMEHVTSRWGVLVLIRLQERPHRFAELRRAIDATESVGPVTEKMLAQTLQSLERDGMVNRDAKPVVPPHVEYSLTELGHEAAVQIRALALWTNDRMDQVEKARETYDASKGRA
ncbi:winged helix-turn-helix transcriptional regulator [Streptomyces liliifuscus]|uniref:Helix-turn-helix transcriptional regulator n=1 Tax=Streptomyces liliifuscus TaxID=2797636 RepID=A0A7T7KXM1_9ACTN|nr:helix-turn-helix domain-containing protein [Streptomyces liliifuscus]QQM42291.1 helix-turn-helix transcriptional regulator [Streptomyces liliifuscus]